VCPTNRNSSSLGNFGNSTSSEKGMVDLGADEGYVALTARLIVAWDSSDRGFPSPKTAFLTFSLAFELMTFAISVRTFRVNMSPRCASGLNARTARAMKSTVIVASIVSCLLLGLTSSAQVKAGSSESQLFDKIASETNPDSKLDLIASFEKQFPSSRILANVYLLGVDVYRQKGDRGKLIEYGEKVLQKDNINITAMMLLARNYAMESKNLDRAIELGQRARDQIVKLRGASPPLGYSAAQWSDYLQTSDTSAGQFLEYVKAVKARQDRMSAPPGGLSEGSKMTPPAVEDSPKEK